MKFELIDQVLEQTETRIVAIKCVTKAEEYLQDHFPKFPVLPGVLMIEALAQAGRRMLAWHGDPRLVLGEVKALRYGHFIRPGDTLKVQVELVKPKGDAFACKGVGHVLPPGTPADSPNLATAVSGRFTLRPIRLLEELPVIGREPG